MARILATLENGQRKLIRWQALAQPAANYSLLIVGGGTAGAVAAVTAARFQRPACVIEPHTFLGGVGTGGGIQSYCAGAAGGVQDDLDAKVGVLDKAICVATRGFHQEAKKAVFDRELQNSTVTVRYRTRLTGVILEGAQVVGVRVVKSGREQDLFGAVTIDCSGDGDAAVLAGAPVRMGRAIDGLPQPYSAPCGALSDTRQVAHRNFDAGYVIPTDGGDMSRALIAGHRQHLIAEYTAANRMIYLAPHLGLREGRFIDGDATMTLTDLIETRRSATTVFETKSFFDNHIRDWAFESDDARIWTVVCGHWGNRIHCDVPYGMLLPRGVDGLLVACRAISLTHDSAQAFRMQRDMQKLGEVAVTAAHLALQKNCLPRAVPIAELQALLTASGCLELPPVAGEPAREGRSDSVWPADAAAIRGKLASDKPGTGIWAAARHQPATIVPVLTNWLEDADANVARAAALALGLRGRAGGGAAAIPALIAMVQRRDTFTPVGGHTQPAWHAAMFLLEYLTAHEAEPVLLDVLRRNADDPLAMGYAVRALIVLSQAAPGRRAGIGAALWTAVTAAGFQPHLKLQVSVGGRENLEPVRAQFELTVAEALLKWDDARGAEILQKYQTSANLRDRVFVDQIVARQIAAPVAV